MNQRKKSNLRSRGKAKGKDFKDREFDRKDGKDEREKSWYPSDNGGHNDPAWYARTAQLLRDAASIPFSWSNGTPIDVHMPSTYPNGMVVPGVISIGLTPSVGYSGTGTSPINVASTALYSFVRHANSGHANYDAPDLMLYTLAMADVYSYINLLMRIYGCATLYSQRNRYLPDGLLKAQKVNIKDVQSNLADFRYGINMLINKAASLAVPASLTLYARRAFLFQNVYCEGTSVKDQLYMYTPDSFYKFEIESTSGAGMLRQTPYGGGTVSQLLAYGDALLSPILSSEDMNIMSGDILKAYGPGGIIKLVELSEYFPIVPVFNIGVLEQMKNATRNTIVTGSANIIQSDSKAYLISQPKAANLLSDAKQAYRLLTTTTADVTPELVIESTRLMTAYAPWDAGDTYQAFVYCGSEIATSVNIIHYDALGTLKSQDVGEYIQLAETGVTVDEVAAAHAIGMVANFKFHPFVGLRAQGKYIPMFDLDNYAVLTPENVYRLHEAALLSELAVPTIAKSTK